MSGGRAVAECLADRLDCRCLAEEILKDAAATIGASEDVLKTKFQTTPGLWSRIVKERERYLLAVQIALIEACQEEGRLVYHGIAGQFLLAGLPGILRVRLIAPLEQRVQALVEGRHRMAPEAARDFIEGVDQERRRWVKVMYDADVEEPSLYDLTVNLRTLTLDAACAAIAEAMELPAYELTDEVRAEWEAFAADRRARLEELQGG